MSARERSEHTPGPWTLAELPGAMGTARVFAGPQQLTHIINKSDARLIAAAPEMLEALQAIAKLNVDDFAYSAVQTARAAIAKATEGES